MTERDGWRSLRVGHEVEPRLSRHDEEAITTRSREAELREAAAARVRADARLGAAERALLATLEELGRRDRPARRQVRDLLRQLRRTREGPRL